MRVTILDYGAGNLHSLAKAVAESTSDVRVETDPTGALEGDVLVLPGVGALVTPRNGSRPRAARFAKRSSTASPASASASACSSCSTRARKEARDSA